MSFIMIGKTPTPKSRNGTGISPQKADFPRSWMRRLTAAASNAM